MHKYNSNRINRLDGENYMEMEVGETRDPKNTPHEEMDGNNRIFQPQCSISILYRQKLVRIEQYN